MTSSTLESVMPGNRTNRAVWVGRVLSGFAILFLAMDAGGKLIAPATMMAESPPLGLPADPGLYRMIGGILGLCTALYAWPRTALLGAVFLTGFLGGTVAVNIRAEMPLVSHTLFGIYLGAMVWSGLWLRDPRVRALLPVAPYGRHPDAPRGLSDNASLNDLKETGR